MKRLIALLGATLLASCTAASPPDSSFAPPSAACPISGASEWAAWVDAMPGPGAKPKLIVTGKVTVPRGGYQFAWGDLRVLESYPVQVVVELRIMPASGAATQAAMARSIRGEWPMNPPVGSVTVRCGDRAVARIARVLTAG